MFTDYTVAIKERRGIGMNTFICYDRCGTCRKAEKWLKDNGIAYEKRPIKEQNPTTDEIRQWRDKSGLPTKKLFNTSGTIYREMNLKDRLPDMTDEEMIQLLGTDDMLVKRPIMVTDDCVLVGFKEADWAEKVR
jgi:arsenate reductase